MPILVINIDEDGTVLSIVDTLEQWIKEMGFDHEILNQFQEVEEHQQLRIYPKRKKFVYATEGNYYCFFELQHKEMLKLTPKEKVIEYKLE